MTMKTTEEIIEETREKRKGGPGRYKKDDARSGRPTWVPAKWQPEYDLIVALSIQGYSQTAIATRLGYTNVHVGNILRTPQSRAMIDAVSARIRNETATTIPDRLVAMGNKAVENMEEIISDETLRESHPIQLFDRSVQVLQSLGKMARTKEEPKNGSNVSITNAIIVPPEHVKTFMGGLAKMEQYKALPSGE